MKDTMMLGTALLLVLVGCTSVRTVDLAQDAHPENQITAVDGRRSYGSDVVRTSDSTWWTDAAGQRRVLANAQVAAVEDVPRPEGYRDWPEGVAEINTLAWQRQARVTLANGRSYLADHLHVARDMATWFNPDTGVLYRVPTDSIETVGFRDGKGGTLRGLAVGSAVGALTGMAVGLASGGDSSDEWFAMTAGQKAAGGGLVFGLLGAPVGAILGSGSEEVFRFRRATLAAASPQETPVAGPGAARLPSQDSVDTEHLPAPSAELAGSRWTVSVIGAGAVGGPVQGLEDGMRASGFGESSSGCFLFCSDDEERIPHPSSSGSMGWLIDVHRQVWSRGKLGFVVGRIGWETRGYDGNDYLSVNQTVTTYAPIVSLQATSALRLGLGPALYRVGTQRTDSPEGAVRQTRLGLVFDFALTFPSHTRFYVDLRAQYRHAGSVEVGPFEVRSLDHVSVLRPMQVGLGHGFIGAGIGIRL